MRFGAGPPPPRPRASSVGTAVGALSIVAIVMRSASPQLGPFHLRNFGGRDFVLTLDAPAGYQDHGYGGEEAKDRQPPDLPDQRKTHDHRKESGNETGRAVARHFDRFIFRFDRGTPGALHVPERVGRLDSWQRREVVGRRWRRG